MLTSPHLLMPVNLLQLMSMGIYLFAIVLLVPSPRMRGLTGLLLLEAALLGFNFAEETGGLRYLITPVFSLCTGPAFYLFVRHLVYADKPWQWREAGHFVPALCALPFTVHVQGVLALGTLSLLVYGLLTFRLVGRYHEALGQMSVDTESQALRWLTRFMVLFALLAATDAVRVNSQPYVATGVRVSWYFMHQLLVTAAFVWLITMAIRQPGVFQQLSLYEREVVMRSGPEDDQTDKALFEQIHQQVLDKALFLTPRLSLQQLSETLGLGVKDISGAINRGGGQSFSDYINGLRIGHVQHLLAERPDQPIATLANQAGFNSKTAFNQAFRQHLGTTPSAYLASLVRNPESARTES